MHSILKLALAALPLLVRAAPSDVVKHGKTHVVAVGKDGLTFTPNFVNADVGDFVQFSFHPKNHTVTQSAFDTPCLPLEDANRNHIGFDTGFNYPVDASATTFPSHLYFVFDRKPKWFYCNQPLPTFHCAAGMGFAINPPSTGNTIDAYIAKAKQFKPSSASGPGSLPAGTSKNGNTPQTHAVSVGKDGLTYTPPFVNAAVGDTILFTFFAKNHTVTQSAFDTPCVPLASGFDTGFNQFVDPPSTQNLPTKALVIKDTKPLWFYCAQTAPAPHCPAGMVFAVNPPTTGNTLDAFVAKAKAFKAGSAPPPSSGTPPPKTGTPPPPIGRAPPPNTDPAFVQKIITAPTQLQRNKLFSDGDFIFDFNIPANGIPTGNGQAFAANVGNFPALYGENVAMTLGFVGPCGMNTPHTHPRATELAYVVSGAFTTGMFQENGARVVQTNVTAGQATLFPKGSVHFQANLDCTPSMFVAAFGGEDPGTLQAAQGLFGLPAKIVGATFGGLSEAQTTLLSAMIPPNLAVGLDECVKRCNLKVVNGVIQPS